MREFGLVGYPLGHSFSKRYFTDKFRNEGIDAIYENFEIKNIEEIINIIDLHPSLEGFNVTIPHKNNIIPLLTETSKEAGEIGAVNCVKIVTSGLSLRLIGYNTDVVGFEKSLKEFVGESCPQKALILGNGGAAKAVKWVMGKMGIEYKVVSRNPQSLNCNEISYPESEQLISSHKLIINTTPLGMWPKCDSSPDIVYSNITDGHYLFDLIYNPETTKFMKLGSAYGAKVCNGYKMLLYQAEAAWNIWNNK